ncbi:S8 family serine peptidase [Micromonospora chokoriensis]
MSWTTRSALSVSLAVATTSVLIGFCANPAAANDRYVKYYTVVAGGQDDLNALAERLLGDRARSAEVLDLNIGRRQPDGAFLTDAAVLRPGWRIVLPWDAVGADVQYGLPPDGVAVEQVAPSPTRTPPPVTARDRQPPTANNGQDPPTTASANNGCLTAAASSVKSNWAALRLAADQAWPQSRGKGQLVAVVDSGVDSRPVQLAGRVTPGVETVTGRGRGDTDCLGTGTAMAGLIAAQAENNNAINGVAPEATVMPVRVITKDDQAQPAHVAAGIRAAIDADATVLALGSHVDTTNKQVVDAIAGAAKHDIVIVLGAQRNGGDVSPQPQPGDGILRVGGVGVDGRGAADYFKGHVDIVAPGVNVRSISVTGGDSVTSGTEYAVAFVAGAAALVRSAYPDLDAKQVVHRLKATADRMDNGSPPDPAYGWGFLNPSESVTRALPEETGVIPNPQSLLRLSPGEPGVNIHLMIAMMILSLAAATLLALRIRRLLTQGPLRAEEGDKNEEIEPAPTNLNPEKTGSNAVPPHPVNISETR